MEEKCSEIEELSIKDSKEEDPWKNQIWIEYKSLKSWRIPPRTELNPITKDIDPLTSISPD